MSEFPIIKSLLSSRVILTVVQVLHAFVPTGNISVDTEASEGMRISYQDIHYPSVTKQAFQPSFRTYQTLKIKLTASDRIDVRSSGYLQSYRDLMIRGLTCV
jgi:hypothetical protein